MAMMKLPMPAATTFSFLFLVFLLICPHSTVAQVGVCYGAAGNNIPSGQDTINLLKSNGIGVIRLYEPHPDIMNAAKDSNIKIALGFHNDQLRAFAENPNAAMQWVQNNVLPFASSIQYLVVGNEVPVSNMDMAPFVGPAMKNFLNALNAFKLGSQIKVTIAIKTDLLRVNYPPSQGVFGNPGFINPILQFLKENDSPLFANVYTYFGYRDDPKIGLNYALSNDDHEFTDPGNKLDYSSLFDAQVDALHNAIAVGVGSNAANNGMTNILVSESGWSSNGGGNNGVEAATHSNAETYYRNLIKRTKQGTPLRPGPMGIYLFAMYDEDQKRGPPDEQNFGLFTPNDQKPKYNLQFN